MHFVIFPVSINNNKQATRARQPNHLFSTQNQTLLVMMNSRRWNGIVTAEHLFASFIEFLGISFLSAAPV